ncbi:MAG: hypothetical protein EXS13_03090 [Planctomycetes bacterium]|nr:hypothetical protein [Planctomycetota bacterium]
MADEFISFDKVMRDLAMQEEELKRLVSEGEIRAFRDQDKMKFKKEDIERFRRVRDASKDDTLAKEDVPEELVFDEDDANQEVGMATAAIADDSFLEEEAAPAAKAKAPARGARAAPTGGRKRVAVEEEVAGEGAGWKLAIIGATLVLIIGAFAAFDAAKAERSGPWSNIADMFKDK